MNTLLKNLTIIPMTEDEYYFSGDIGIMDGKILFIGQDDDFIADETKDCTNMLALPGFINTHTHLAMTLLRNYKDQAPCLMDWLNEIFPIEDKIVKNDVYYASLTGLVEFIQSGITTFADMYMFQSETVKAVKEAGLRAIIGQTFFGDINETRRRINEIYPTITKSIENDDLFRIDAAPHAIYTTSAQTYTYAKDWAKERNSFIHTHLSETKVEMDNCIKEHDMLPAEYLEKLGFFNDKNTYLAHGVWLQDKELEIIKNASSSVIHNPSSNCKLASGIAPIAKYKNYGINVALGTDGASSNNSLSILKEMRLTAMLSSVSTFNPIALKPYEILKMATINGARALGLDNKIGTLSPGKEADIILINTDNASMTPLNNIFSALVYSMNENSIDTVFVKGKKLMENRVLLTLDEKEIIKNTNIICNDLIRR